MKKAGVRGEGCAFTCKGGRFCEGSEISAQHRKSDHQLFRGDRSIRSIVFVSANEQRPLDAALRPFVSNRASQWEARFCFVCVE